MNRLNNEDVRKTAGGILANLTESENLKITKKVLTDLNGTVETKVLEEGIKEKKGSKLRESVKLNRNRKSIKEAVKPGKTPKGADKKVKGEGKEPLAEGEDEIEEIKDEVIEEVPEETIEVDKDMTDSIAKATELIAKIFANEVSDEDRDAARNELMDLVAGGVEEVENNEELPLEVEDKEEIVEEGCEPKKEEEEIEVKDEEKAEEKIVEGLKIVAQKNNTYLLKESTGYIVGKNYNKETGLIESAETYKTEFIAKKAFNKMSK